MALDFRDQYFGCEIEMTGLTRQQAARTLAELFGTSITHYGGTYDAKTGKSFRMGASTPFAEAMAGRFPLGESTGSR